MLWIFTCTVACPLSLASGRFDSGTNSFGISLIFLTDPRVNHAPFLERKAPVRNILWSNPTTSDAWPVSCSTCPCQRAADGSPPLSDDDKFFVCLRLQSLSLSFASAPFPFALPPRQLYQSWISFSSFYRSHYACTAGSGQWTRCLSAFLILPNAAALAEVHLLPAALGLLRPAVAVRTALFCPTGEPCIF